MGNTYLLLRQQPQPQPQLLEKLPPLQLQPLFQLPVKPPRPLLPPRNPTQIMIQTATILILQPVVVKTTTEKLPTAAPTTTQPATTQPTTTRPATTQPTTTQPITKSPTTTSLSTTTEHEHHDHDEALFWDF